MKIGILGGAFNPPHKAHRAVAELAREALNLDQVLLIPCSLPSHEGKSAEDLAPAEARLAMTRALVAGAERLAVDDREIRRGGRSYTIETVEEILEENPAAAIFVIIGSDWLAGLPTWREIETLAERVTFAVVRRPGFRRDKEPSLPGIRMIEIPAEPMEISSRYIRARLAKGQDVVEFVGEAVNVEIERRGVYR